MANFNFNEVILGGRLTADPELKTTQSGIAVTTFTVAVNRRNAKDGGEKADFFNVTAWRTTAEFITKYFRKASSICIIGELQNRTWEKDGQKHYATEIVANEAYFVNSKDDMPIMANPPTVPAVKVAATPEAVQAQFEEIGDDEELPF